jgi:hypothetical protein
MLPPKAKAKFPAKKLVKKDDSDAKAKAVVANFFKKKGL